MHSNRRSRVIAISGKGGVGKTTTSALLLKYFTSKQPLPNILVIDVDPDTNIPDVLGLQIERNHTVGGIAKELRERINKGKLEPGFDKASFLEAKTFEIIKELDKFDLLVMSKSEGEGCYCFINSAITDILDTIQAGYDIILIDTAAGLEHFSRRTMRDVDDLFIVTDASAMGLKTTERIIEITREMTLNVNRIHVLGNRFEKNNEHYLHEKFSNIDERVDVLGFLPYSSTIQECNMTGRSLLDLDDNNETYRALIEFMQALKL